MTPTEQFIRRLGDLETGEWSRLRRLAGRPLDETLPGFDLFAGLWWPLREKSAQTPRREPSWLVAKLFGACPLKQAEGTRLPTLLGRCEPREEFGQKRFRDRFDALLQTPLSGLEGPLGWGLSVAADAVEARRAKGIDWVQLLDEVSIWDRGAQQRRRRDVRDLWAEEYLQAAEQPGGS